MSLILKKEQHFISLFKALNLQERLLINKNINDAVHLLKIAPDKVRQLMAEQNVHVEDLLTEKCMPLIRFYLSDDKTQLQYFLDSKQMVLLFKALPMAEATIFKQHLSYGQAMMALPDNDLQALLASEGLITNTEETKGVGNVVDFQGEHVHLHKLQKLTDSDNSSNRGSYDVCYYGVNKQEESLTIHTDYQEGFLLYCELSPLMQIKAQQLFKETTCITLSSTA